MSVPKSARVELVPYPVISLTIDFHFGKNF
jgi:hypothetical protein